MGSPPTPPGAAAKKPARTSTNTWADRAMRRLVALRWLSAAVMLASLPLANLLGLRFPGAALVAVVLALAGINFLTLGWLARTPAPTSHHAFLLQLMLDLGAWTTFLYFTGGATNPLISIFLPLLAIGAAMLPAAHAWAMAGLSVAAYSFLWEYNRPIRLDDPALAAPLHLGGMWLTFVLSASVIAGFVVRMSAALRERDRALAAAAEAMARAEHIVALGNLAAGTAHSLGTPLGTIRLVAGEMLASPDLPASLREEVRTIDAQVEHCRHSLAVLAAQAGQSRAEGGRTASARSWLEDSLARWHAQRPRAAIDVACDPSLDGVRIVIDATLTQALQTLANNAADVSPKDVAVEARVTGGELVIAVSDRGPGVPASLRELAGDAPWTECPNGMGIGLFLAASTLRRHGGALSFESREGGGTIARLRIPLQRIQA